MAHLRVIFSFAASLDGHPGDYISRYGLIFHPIRERNNKLADYSS